MDQTNCPDCRLLYKTEEGVVEIDAHMFILTKSAYLDALFRWQESVPVKVGKKYINQYTVDIPFDYSLMDFCVKMMYDVEFIKSIDSELYADLFAIIDFLQLDNMYYDKIIYRIFAIIDKLGVYSTCFNIITAVCNSNIEISKKHNFVARTFYLLNEEDKQTIDKKYIPEHIYYGKSCINNGNIIICGDDTFKYNGHTFNTDSEWYNLKSCQLRLFRSYFGDYTVNLVVFDRNGIKCHDMCETFEVPIDMYTYYKCDVFVNNISGPYLYEFILTPKKNENPN